MALRTSQIFVENPDVAAVATALREYVAKNGKKFTPHPRYVLNGEEQVLRCLVKTQRNFLILADKRWTSVWEVVDHCAFADPAIARFLAAELATEAIWVNCNEEYNIWAFQIYVRDHLKQEKFLPRRYFLGDVDYFAGDKNGSCHDRAAAFNATRKLPAFLASLSHMERSPSKYRDLRKIKCRLPKAED